MARKDTTRQTVKPSQPATRLQFITCFIIFVVGFLAGVAFTVYKSKSITPSVSTATSEQQAPPHNEEIHQSIIKLEAEVTARPGDFQAWTHLGNLYFDTGQAVKAIAAYNKSLELHKGDANILTDLGVMYRTNKQPEKAIDMFNRAIADNPTHLPARYNKGIVMFYDLGDQQGAITSWEEMLAIDPQAKNSSGMTIRELIDQVKAKPPASK